jgi:hypothetical protein
LKTSATNTNLNNHFIKKNKFKTYTKNQLKRNTSIKPKKVIDPIRLYTEKQLLSKINIFSLGYQHRNLWRIKKKASIDKGVPMLDKENEKKKNLIKKKKKKRISYLFKIGALKRRIHN